MQFECTFFKFFGAPCLFKAKKSSYSPRPNAVSISLKNTKAQLERIIIMAIPLSPNVFCTFVLPIIHKKSFLPEKKRRREKRETDGITRVNNDCMWASQTLHNLRLNSRFRSTSDKTRFQIWQCEMGWERERKEDEKKIYRLHSESIFFPTCIFAGY